MRLPRERVRRDDRRGAERSGRGAGGDVPGARGGRRPPGLGVRRDGRRAVVVLGASVAGATAAASLRERGHDGPIALLGNERLPPYERPPMSKEYLRGEQPFERALVRDPDWYEEHGIEIRLGVRVERLDLDG